MGVLKNDVGRPSNKNIRTRFILKLIGLILVVGLAFIGGYKFSGNKEETKTSKPTNEEKVSKYDDFDFVSASTVSFNYVVGNTVEYVVANLVDGDVIFKLNDGTILENKFDKKVKSIASFNIGFSDPGADFAALTYDGELYVLDHKETNITFKKVDYNKKIKKLFILDEWNYKERLTDYLYVLTDDDELLKVNVEWIEGENAWYPEYKIEGKYEERVTQIGCTNGNCYWGEIYAKDNTVKLEILTVTDGGYDVTYKDIKYNNKKVKVKYLFDFNSIEEYNDLQKLYIVTEDGDLLVTKSGIHRGTGCTDDSCYEFIKLKKSKVTNAELIDETTVKLTYENGDAEEFKTVYDTYNIN